jgi:uncharacterized protein YggE
MKYFIAFVFTFFVLSVSAQMNMDLRYIEVRGTSEMEVEPDEIVFSIGIEEYWEEEFEKNKDFEDYKTKVPLAEIEDKLIKNLRKAGIPKKDIRVKNLGNYWRHRGKEFLYSKQLEVTITDFEKMNVFTQFSDARGIKFMNISELNHTKMNKFKKQVKTEALQNAKEKAGWMLQSLDEELGEVISIVEMNEGFARPYATRTRMMVADSSLESVDQLQNIEISYQVQVRFRIK